MHIRRWKDSYHLHVKLHSLCTSAGTNTLLSRASHISRGAMDLAHSHFLFPSLCSAVLLATCSQQPMFPAFSHLIKTCCSLPDKRIAFNTISKSKPFKRKERYEQIAVQLNWVVYSARKRKLVS